MKIQNSTTKSLFIEENHYKNNNNCINISNNKKKMNITLLFLPTKKLFHSIVSQHFNFINVGFFFDLPNTDIIKMNI